MIVKHYTISTKLNERPYLRMTVKIAEMWRNEIPESLEEPIVVRGDDLRDQQNHLKEVGSALV